MYVNFVEGEIRFFESSFPDADEVPEEIYGFRAYAENDQVEPEEITQDIRKWLLAGPHTHFTLDEKRRYADIGAEASSLHYVLELLGSGAAGVAVSEIYQWVKGRIGGRPDEQWQRERFIGASDEQHRDEALGLAERLYGFRRGELQFVDMRREELHVVVRAEHPGIGRRFRIELNADESHWVQQLPTPTKSKFVRK